jgi:hypothetical protein
MREVTRFQEQHGLQSWPCIIGGGRSSTPSSLRIFGLNEFFRLQHLPEDPAYAILLGDPIDGEATIRSERFFINTRYRRSFDPGGV